MGEKITHHGVNSEVGGRKTKETHICYPAAFSKVLGLYGGVCLGRGRGVIMKGGVFEEYYGSFATKRGCISLKTCLDRCFLALMRALMGPFDQNILRVPVLRLHALFVKLKYCFFYSCNTISGIIARPFITPYLYE